MLLEGAHIYAGTIIYVVTCTDLCNCVDCENGDDMNSDIIIENDEEDSNNFENDNVDN